MFIVALFMAVFTLSGSAVASSQQESRILRGDNAGKEWPGVVSIEDRAFSVYGGHAAHVCGGTLIGRRWVLTAVHCVFDGYGQQASLDVLVGTRNLRTRKPQRRSVVYRYIHPKYAESASEFDVALLYLNRPTGQKPARLLNEQPPVSGDTLWAVGWGAMKNRYPARLQQESLTVADSCGRNGVDPRYIVCANSPRTGRSVCAGDSGGPLFKADGTLVAVADFSGVDSYRCWSHAYPSGFVRLDPLMPWIDRVMAKPPPAYKKRDPYESFGTKKLPVSFSVRGANVSGPGTDLNGIFFAEIASTYPIKSARLYMPDGTSICSDSPEGFPDFYSCWNSGFPAPMVRSDGADRAGLWFTSNSRCLKGLTIRVRVGRKTYNEPWDLCA